MKLPEKTNVEQLILAAPAGNIWGFKEKRICESELQDLPKVSFLSAILGRRWDLSGCENRNWTPDKS